MPATCAVSCQINDQKGQPLAGAVVVATLNGFEIDQGYIAPKSVDATTDSLGKAVLDLWPNQVGSLASFYKIKITAPNGQILRTKAVVPNTPTAQLHLISELPPFEGKTLSRVVLEQVIDAAIQAEAKTSAAALALNASVLAAVTVKDSLASTIAAAQLKGDKGDTGATGPQGAQGETGPIGLKGDQGLEGPRGLQGEKGETGFKGDKGDTGAKGDTGDVGATGPQGEIGPQGIQGIQGEVGPKGNQGDKGDKGDTGLTGATGAQGPKGDPGIDGDKHYAHDQTQAEAQWVIEHNLSKYPSVTITDSAGDQVEGEVRYNGLNSLTLSFSAPFSGRAYLN